MRIQARKSDRSRFIHKVVWEYQNGYRQPHAIGAADPQNTFLIAVEAAGKVIEVNRDGKIIWTYEAEGANTRFPYQAHRLSNGNTLISLAEPGELLEVDAAGKIVRRYAGRKTDAVSDGLPERNHYPAEVFL
ncbi:MAG: hypothetical protein U0V70_13140 [Terriglobia bacterium]